MNTSYSSYTEVLRSHTQDSSSPENVSPVLPGYRYGLSTNESFENNFDIETQQLTYMEDVCTDFQNQQILSANSLLKSCAGCGDKISDRFLLYALDRYWHNSCLKCHYCGTMLAEVGTSCFTRRGLILCKKDYSSIFGSSGICSGCGLTIPPSEMVTKAMPGLNVDTQKQQKQITNCVFHLKCFSCANCGTNLRPGDRYTIVGTRIICEQDWQKIKNSPSPNGNLPTRKGKVGRPRRAKD